MTDERTCQTKCIKKVKEDKEDECRRNCAFSTFGAGENAGNACFCAVDNERKFSCNDAGKIQKHVLGHVNETKCERVIDSVLGNRFIDCVFRTRGAFSSIEAECSPDGGECDLSEDTLKTACHGSCLTRLVSGVNELNTKNGCIPSDTNDDIFGGDDPLDFAFIMKHDEWLEMLCTRRSGTFCGITYKIVRSYIHTGKVSEKDCTIAVKSGDCQGTIKEVTGVSIDRLIKACQDKDVTGIKMAANSTE